MSQPVLRRREAITLLGATVVAGAVPGFAMARTGALAAEGNAITVAVGRGAAFDAALRELQRQTGGNASAVIRHDEPWYAWSQTIAPQIARGGAVFGLADGGFAFCLERLAAEARADFALIEAKDAGNAGSHLPLAEASSAIVTWRILARNRGNFPA